MILLSTHALYVNSAPITNASTRCKSLFVMNMITMVMSPEKPDENFLTQYTD